MDDKDAASGGVRVESRRNSSEAAWVASPLLRGTRNGDDERPDLALRFIGAVDGSGRGVVVGREEDPGDVRGLAEGCALTIL